MGVKAGWPDFYFLPEPRKAIVSSYFEKVELPAQSGKDVITAEYAGVLLGLGFGVSCPDGGFEFFTLKVEADDVTKVEVTPYALEVLSGIPLHLIAEANADKYVVASSVSPRGGMTCEYYDSTKGYVTFGGGFLNGPFEFAKKLVVRLENKYSADMEAWLTALIGRYV